MPGPLAHHIEAVMISDLFPDKQRQAVDTATTTAFPSDPKDPR